MSEIEYIGKGTTSADVLIDGHEISGVTRICFEHSAADIPIVTLDLAGTEIDMHAQRISISSDCAKVVIRKD